MKGVDWRQVLVFGLVALLVFLVGTALISPVTGGWGGGMMGSGGGTMMGLGAGMMGGGLAWMWMALVPLLVLAALVVGIVWLAQQVSGSTTPPSTPAGGRDVTTCPQCGRHLRADWLACPYCGTVLGSDEREGETP